ncbi:twin-arginine translocation signal domain-containing protein, partial [Pseudomonas donghuensis]
MELKRRQLLKFAGATAAVGGLGLHVGLASAAEPVAG